MLNLGWLYTGSLWVLIFLGDHRYVPVMISRIPLFYLVALTLLASFAVSDILLEIIEAIKPTLRAWGDRKHFRMTFMLTIPIFAVNQSFIDMMKALGSRIGQP